MKADHLREVLASLVVFLVALPLCMGVAIASGAPAAAGLVAGIVGGLVVGVLAGSPLQVSGPAAGLAVIVYEAIQQHGYENLWAVVIVAGVIQIFAAKLSAGRWFRAVAPAVIYAMLAGIGVLILASQFHVMVDDTPKGSGLQNLLTIPSAIWKGITPVAGTAHHFAAAIGLVTLVCLVGWSAIKQRSSGWLSVVPAPLVAIVVATAAAAFNELPIQYVAVPESLGELFSLPTSGISALWAPAILTSGVAMAVIASAESLLCASAVDRLHDGERSDLDRELFAQGVGNAVSGLIGGLPVTGVIVRSTANVQAGGKTRWAAVMHGIWLLGFVALAPNVLAWIPVSALAAVLVYIGFKLVDRKIIRELAERGRGELAVYGVTLAGIVAIDLLTGLAIGIAVTFVRLAWGFSHVEIKIEKTGETYDIDLHGSATFMSMPSLSEALEALPAGAPVRIRLDHLHHIDHACLDFIGEWERQREDAGGTLEVAWEVLEGRSASVRQQIRGRNDVEDSSPPPQPPLQQVA